MEQQQQIFKLFLSSNLLKMEILSPIYKQSVRVNPARFGSKVEEKKVFNSVRKALQLSHDIEKCLFVPTDETKGEWIAYTNRQMQGGAEEVRVLNFSIELRTISEEGNVAFVSTNAERIIVLRHLARELFQQLEYHEFENGFFNPIDPPNAALSKDKTIVYQTYSWNGFRPVTIEFRGKVYLQLETTPLRMLRMNVLDLISDLKKKKFSKENIANFLVGKRVKSSYFSGNLFFEIVGIEFEMTPQTIRPARSTASSLISNEEGLEPVLFDCSFEEEMRKLHRINIRDKDQPMLRVRVLERGFKQLRLDTKNNKAPEETYLIPSLCSLIGELAQKGVVDDNLGMEFYHEPLEVFEQVNRILRFLKTSEKVEALLSGWHVKIADTCENIGYHYLKLSNILLRSNSVNEPRSAHDLVCKRLCNEFDGHYQALFCAGDSFTKFAPLERWAIFVHSGADTLLCEGLISSVSQFRMYYSYAISEPKYFKVDSLDMEQWEQVIRTSLETFSPQFALVIMNTDHETAWFYRRIKQLLTVERSVPCSIIKSSTLTQYLSQYTQQNSQSQQQPQPIQHSGKLMSAFSCRFLTQMQAKLGESPWLVKELPFNSSPTTMIGLSVLRNAYSRKIIVGGSCSINKQYSKYQSDYRVISELVQTGSGERSDEDLMEDIGSAMKDIVKGFLSSFSNLHKTHPTWVIIVRDGQFLHNAENEKNGLLSMLSSRRSASEQRSFHLLFSTSLFETGLRTYSFSGSHSEHANIQNVYSPGAGTLIEKNFNKREFYLYTQKNVKNCPFPVHYSVLHIDKIVPHNELTLLSEFQELLYNTFLLNYTLHTKTISPACLQNARKLALFVQMFLTPPNSPTLTIDLSNLRAMTASYKLFFI